MTTRATQRSALAMFVATSEMQNCLPHDHLRLASTMIAGGSHVLAALVGHRNTAAILYGVADKHASQGVRVDCTSLDELRAAAGVKPPAPRNTYRLIVGLIAVSFAAGVAVAAIGLHLLWRGGGL